MSDAAFHLRIPGLADADAIAEVHVQGWRESYAGALGEYFYDDAALERRKTMWRAILGDAEVVRKLAVAEVQGKIIGFALASATDEEQRARDVELRMIYVLAEHHGTGVGQALLDEVLPVPSAQLWVAKENPRAHGFYRRNGFAPDGTEKIDPAVDHLVEIRMVR